mgnify:CR=1 FL=1
MQEVLVKSSKQYQEGVHYYMEGERVIFTDQFHIVRGQCCGNGCIHCPYEPKHKKGNQIFQEKYLVTKAEIGIFNKIKGYGKTRTKNDTERDK